MERKWRPTYNDAIRVLRDYKDGKLPDLSETDAKEIEILLSQYDYGIQAQKNLYYKLKSLTLIN